MRSNEVFARMSGEEALRFLEQMREEAPQVAKLALGAAANAFRLRPEFLKRQPRPRQAEWMRRALGRTIGSPLAEEVLATYFLDHELELLTELLDGFGVEHDEGRLDNPAPDSPDAATLQKAVAAFRKGESPEKRELLLNAFAAQSSIEWPELEALLDRSGADASAPPAARATAAPAPAPTAKKTTRKKAAPSGATAERKSKAATKAKGAKKKAKATAKKKPASKKTAKKATKKKR